MRRWQNLQTALFALLVLVAGAAASLRMTSFRLPPDADALRGEATKAFESRYDHVFPARSFGICAWGALEYLLFREGRAGVIVGTDGWLYTDEEFKAGPDAAEVLRRNLAAIERVHHELQLRNILLVVALVPAKARVYPEHLGRRQPTSAHRKLYDDVHARLQQSGVPAPDLLRALQAAKNVGPMYLRTDTHWTPLGASVAAQEIAAVVDHLSPARGAAGAPAASYVSRSLGTQLRHGDLLSFLPLDPYFHRWLPAPEAVESMRAEVVGANGDAAPADAVADLFADTPVPQIALVGTSYSADPLFDLPGFLKSALQEDLVSYAREGVGPMIPMFDYLNGEDLRAAAPRAVIWEIPERYLLVDHDLSRYPPAAASAGAAPLDAVAQR